MNQLINCDNLKKLYININVHGCYNKDNLILLIKLINKPKLKYIRIYDNEFKVMNYFSIDHKKINFVNNDNLMLRKASILDNRDNILLFLGLDICKNNVKRHTKLLNLLNK